MAFKLEFKIKQHTPIIHFQHGQPGATLRATELKPKFDKYLIKIFNKENTDYKKKWLIGKGDHPALDYEVKIQSNSEKATLIEKPSDRRDIPFPMFFGNMENERGQSGSSKKYKFKITNKIFTIELFSLHTGLVEQLNTHFQEFLFKTNFGTRQSKGFGSFSALEGGVAFSPSSIPFFKVNSTDADKLFRTIALFYKALRGGINGFTNLQTGRFERDFYMKSFIFAYAKKHNIQWDKKTVKQQFYPQLLEEEIDRHSSEDRNRNIIQPDNLAYSSEKVFDVKDLLGLSTSEQWKLPDDRGRYSRSFMITKETTDSEIDRFQSPITFKPIRVEKGFKVYVLLRKISSKYLKTSVNFSKQNGGSFILPIWKDFSIKDFFEFVLDTNHLDLIPNVQDQRNAFAREIGRILQELKSTNRKNG